jgi:hypothetical protein
MMLGLQLAARTNIGDFVALNKYGSVGVDRPGGVHGYDSSMREEHFGE